MRKWLAGFLCVMLVLGVANAGAEGAPWLSPWLKYFESMESGEKTVRLDVRLSTDLDKMEKEMNANLSYYAGAELIRATGIEYLRALSAFLAETTVGIAAEKGRFLLEMTVGEHLLLDLAGQETLAAEGTKRVFTTNLLPSFVFSATGSFTDNPDETLRKARETIDALIVCAKENGSMNILRENIENDRQQAEYFLNGADKKTLSSEEYAALLPGAPRAAENSAYGVVGAIVAKHFDAMDGTMDLYAATDGATYAFEKTEEGYVARMTVAEAGEEGNEKFAVSTTTIKKDSVVYDDMGYANAGENRRITIDLSDPDLSRITYVSETSSGWINFARNGLSQRVSCHLKDGEVDMKGETSASDDGEMDIRLTVNDMITVFARCALEPTGTLAAPDVAGKTEIVYTADESGRYSASRADMALIQNELYTVTRPKMIDFALSKLPKGAEGLTTAFLSLATQIGSGNWLINLN